MRLPAVCTRPLVYTVDRLELEGDSRQFRPVLLYTHSIDQRLSVVMTPLDE